MLYALKTVMTLMTRRSQQKLSEPSGTTCDRVAYGIDILPGLLDCTCALTCFIRFLRNL